MSFKKTTFWDEGAKQSARYPASPIHTRAEVKLKALTFTAPAMTPRCLNIFKIVKALKRVIAIMMNSKVRPLFSSCLLFR